MIGRTISHYKVVDKLGEGGMGAVYKAEDTTLNRLVALKTLSRHLSENGNNVFEASGLPIGAVADVVDHRFPRHG